MFCAVVFIFLQSCNDSSDKSVVTQTNGSYETVELDSCEYIVFREWYKGGITHKGNCKFCETRKR